MIEIKGLTKRFGSITAVDSVDAAIKEGSIFGLVGTNGAGKSTLLRMLAGILKPDGGTVTIDSLPVFENPAAKELVFYISDDHFFFMNDTPGDLMKLYENTYEGFDREQFLQLMDEFALPAGRRISSFSKGMKKQLLVALGVCAGTKYILCDETFDGLDPLMRKRVKDIFARYMESRGLTPVIASHSLRELEDICDHVGLLHQGGILLSGDLRDMKLSVHKIQFVTRSEESFEGLDVVTCSHKGSLYTLTVRGEKEEILKKLRAMDSIFYELIPLSLEEIFISETEVKGYDVSKIL